VVQEIALDVWISMSTSIDE